MNWSTIGQYQIKFSNLLRRQDFFNYTLVFFIYFLSAKYFLELYFAYQTAPAIIWPAFGIALLAVMFGGYRMAIPIFLAQFFAVFTSIPGSWSYALITAFGYALQTVASLYFLRRFNFKPALDKLKNTLIFVDVAFLCTLIEPVISTIGQAMLDTLPVSPLLNLGRAWGAGIFSALIITPFILTWHNQHIQTYSLQKKIETFSALAILAGMLIFLFWTPYITYFGISVIFFLPAVLIWFAVRFPIKWLTLALMMSSILAILGAFLTNHNGAPLSVQLFSVEIYVALLAAIFLVFAAIIEDRRVGRRKLEVAYKSIVEANEAKSQFIAILAHELRNPLAPIVSSLELLKLEPQTTNATRLIGNAEDHTIMISRILDDLLDTARLSQKKFILKKEATLLNEIIAQCVSSVTDFVEAHQHKLTTTLPNSEMWVSVDPVRLKQILINLLNNAAKYTEPGGKIELCVEQAASEYKIEVRDNGIGIEREMLPKIFEPFKQLEIRPESGTGLGLGLFLTQRLVQLNDGRIEVTSQGLGLGSTFTVYLPIPFNLTKPTVESKVSSEKNALPSRILVIDDNEAAADALAALLRHHGHTVEVAYSGEAGLGFVKSFQPHLILLDLTMPHMDGFQVARTMRKNKWEGKIVALTGSAQDIDRTKAKEAGCDHHLAKPVRISDIITILKSMQVIEQSLIKTNTID